MTVMEFYGCDAVHPECRFTVFKSGDWDNNPAPLDNNVLFEDLACDVMTDVVTDFIIGAMSGNRIIDCAITIAAPAERTPNLFIVKT